MLVQPFGWKEPSIPERSLLFRLGGCVVGRPEDFENKANSVEFKLKLQVWTELGKNIHIYAHVLLNGDSIKGVEKSSFIYG